MSDVDPQPRPAARPPRRRPFVFAALVAVVALGLFSRTPAGRLPWAEKEAGDVLFATMFYLWAVLLMPRLRPTAAAAIAVAATFSIEFLKLYHAPWIEAVRANRLAGFLLGHTFYWHDLACYTFGVIVGLALDGVWMSRRPRRLTG